MTFSRREVLKMLEGCDLTGFQKEVLVVTAGIERGKVMTYGEVAEKMGNPRAYRAVGTALGKNPLAPRIPCHRVIRSNGKIGNYSGKGGSRTKLMLLTEEGALKSE